MILTNPTDGVSVDVRPTRLVAMGHSYTVGVGTTTPATDGMINQLRLLMGLSTNDVVNLGVSGAVLSYTGGLSPTIRDLLKSPDVSARFYTGTGPYVPKGGGYVIVYGYNDALRLAPGLPAYGESLRALIDRINTAFVIDNQHPFVTLSGTTSIETPDGSGLSPFIEHEGTTYTRLNGNDGRIQVSLPDLPPGEIIVGGLGAPTAGLFTGGTANVSINGGRPVSVNQSVNEANSANFHSQTTKLWHNGGRATVMIAATNATTATPWRFDYLAYAPREGRPAVALADVPRVVSQDTRTDAILDQYTAVTAGIAAEYGGQVQIASFNHAMQDLPALITDGVHPNTAGSYQCARVLLGALQRCRVSTSSLVA